MLFQGVDKCWKQARFLIYYFMTYLSNVRGFVLPACFSTVASHCFCRHESMTWILNQRRSSWSLNLLSALRCCTTCSPRNLRWTHQRLLTVHLSPKALREQVGAVHVEWAAKMMLEEFPSSFVCCGIFGAAWFFSWGPIPALTWPPLNFLCDDLGDLPWLLQVHLGHSFRGFQVIANCSGLSTF